MAVTQTPRSRTKRIKRIGLRLPCLLLLVGCAMTDEARFPLDTAFADRMWADVEMARQALALLRIGNSYLSLNAPQKAIPFLQEALRAIRKAGLDYIVVSIPDTRIMEADIHAALSWAYRSAGYPEAGLSDAMRAVRILETSAWRVKAYYLYELKGGYPKDRFGNLIDKVEAWKRISDATRQYAQALGALGWVYLDLGWYNYARSEFQKVLDIGQELQHPQLMALAHSGMGLAAYRQSQFQVAIGHLQEALQLYSRPATVASTRSTLGRVYRAMGSLPEAEEALRSSVAGYEDLRSLLESETLRESFFEDKISTYEVFVLALLDQGKAAEAFDVSERARARAFLDLLGNRVIISRGRNQTLIAEERALRERISALKARPLDSPASGGELEHARDAYQAFLERVRRLDREQASLMSVETLALKEVQALLPEGSVLLEYFVTDEKTLLWTVDRGTFSVTTLPLRREDLANRVQAFRDLIGSRERQAEMRDMAQTLFDQLVRPGLGQRVPKELLIVPHDALHYLPFQALMPARDRYLIQEVPIYYYSSASLMQFTKEKQQSITPGALAVGNPDLDNPTLNLRYAEREAREVQRLFPETTVLVRTEATKQRTRSHLSKHPLVHLATHAELDDQDPLGSALLFRPDGTDDGRLEVQEIFGLNLQASLVVLSACDTALGKLTRGDELTGLTRAFIYAGTPSVINTLWQVNDRASYELMREFYRHLKAGRDKAESLRRAQLATLQRYPHPYYWAAYQLTGEPR
jgi:CHAT domain-containing protein